MTNELLSGLPTQFIEGINECAKYEKYDDKSVFLDKFGKFAIEYKPKSSFCLLQVDLLIQIDTRIHKESIKVTLLSDYLGEPSDITLSEGQFTPVSLKEGIKRYWQSVELQPVVIIRNKTYWVSIDCNWFGLMSANHKIEQQCNVKVQEPGGTMWKPGSEKGVSNTAFMLRFFGKVLPVTD